MADKPVTLNRVQRGLLALFGLRPEDLPGHKRGELEMSWVEFLRSGLDPFTGYAQISQDRIVRYNDYDLMDQYSDIATALDIYAEEVSQPDPRKHKVAWIETENKAIKEEGRKWMSAMRIEDRAYALARNVAKYGDTFEYQLTNQNGVYNMQFIHPSRVTRIESDKLMGFQCDELARLMLRAGLTGGPEGRYFTPWDFVHFRIEAFDRETIYGRSLIENVRKTWKELQILETMIAVYRVTKSVQRNVYIIDVSSASPQEAREVLEKYRLHLKRQQFIDPQTGDFRIDAAAVTPLEDIILPIRGKDNQTRIEKLAADPDIGAVEDLHYFRTKLRTALGIPKSYFDQELETGGGWNAKEALVLQDQRFSRKMVRIQHAVKSGLLRGLAIHLTMKGIKWEPGDFKIEMAPVNQISERLKEEWWLRRATLLQALIPVAELAGFDPMVWNKLVCEELLPLSDRKLKELLKPPPMMAVPVDPTGAGPSSGASGGAGGGGGAAPMAPTTFPSFPDPNEDADEARGMLSDLFAKNPDARQQVASIMEAFRRRSDPTGILEEAAEIMEERKEFEQYSKDMLSDYRERMDESADVRSKRVYYVGAEGSPVKHLSEKQLTDMAQSSSQLEANDKINPTTGKKRINEVTVPMDFSAIDRKRA